MDFARSHVHGTEAIRSLHWNGKEVAEVSIRKYEYQCRIVGVGGMPLSMKVNLKLVTQFGSKSIQGTQPFGVSLFSRQSNICKCGLSDSFSYFHVL